MLSHLTHAIHEMSDMAAEALWIMFEHKADILRYRTLSSTFQLENVEAAAFETPHVPKLPPTATLSLRPHRQVWT